jgi:hypothetical protein
VFPFLKGSVFPPPQRWCVYASSRVVCYDRSEQWMCDHCPCRYYLSLQNEIVFSLIFQDNCCSGVLAHQKHWITIVQFSWFLDVLYDQWKMISFNCYVGCTALG